MHFDDSNTIFNHPKNIITIEYNIPTYLCNYIRKIDKHFKFPLFYNII